VLLCESCGALEGTDEYGEQLLSGNRAYHTFCIGRSYVVPDPRLVVLLRRVCT
jgi:hypothetical protein